MTIAAIAGGDERMKAEPFGLLFTYSVAGAASVAAPTVYTVEFVGALALGGFLALCHSLWKSRERKADGINTALWAMIALSGSIGLALFLAPALSGKTVPVVDIVVTTPLAAFLIATGGTPFIEWLLTGEAFAWLRKWGDKFAGKGSA